MARASVEKHPHCFGCGDQNPIGLGLGLQMEDGRLTAEFVPGDGHQGWPGTVHGGIITAMLYEVMENLAYHQGVLTMMKSMETRFRRPASTGRKIVATSWLAEQTGRNMSVSASLADEEGTVIAEGTAILVVLSQEQKERLGLA